MPTSLDLWLTAAVGFLGSFGHCVGMCGPVATAFALSAQQSSQYASNNDAAEDAADDWSRQIAFHLLLNIGRLLSYALVGMGIGALGSVLFAGGQIAGIGSTLRRLVSLATGVLLIWFGLTQASPGFLPSLPFLHPARAQKLHEQINQSMGRVARWQQAIAPLILGLLWGLIPCGFLYTGQLRAAATQSPVGGAAVMLAFGLGTAPAMVVVGMTASRLSQDRRSQLFRLGGWITVAIGTLLLLRTGNTMTDYSGYVAIVCLILALIARPISRLWPGPLRYRRVLGVGAFVLSALHLLHMLSHTWRWNWRAVQFMLPQHQVGMVLGLIAMLLMLPAAVTSFDRAQVSLGSRWRKLHLLGFPALLLAAGHAILAGASYWGALALTWQNQAMVGGLVVAVLGVSLVRSRSFWTLLSQEKNYAPPKTQIVRSSDRDCCDTLLP
ncbi:sulfite exporter TauE/SafE family protein [cf. Phormidesmis sp. LEGE 11477]|uniref:urease accessory protein UreH domain-containing protein n=1 Tax=cf. Phormidesmis sp. LEGE 11477 TaxID=1828680 RepID=UPI00187F8AFF|nr:sulfite exporter TauE/SafE family protein [cf. Phormidesmis sp. LEGE 11477]MBE9063975.1 sulfite exporter TauE/SafE family protein [cf. Phormidesmis sp. LEGE 11477]